MASGQLLDTAAARSPWLACIAAATQIRTGIKLQAFAIWKVGRRRNKSGRSAATVRAHRLPDVGLHERAAEDADAAWASRLDVARPPASQVDPRVVGK
ncbi:MAG: hypothetical protein JWR55_382 [Aeromicrobium sp.]|jgi:hypothetical protein|nr:hypothetical protein [Aeromicrobium sp.]